MKFSKSLFLAFAGLGLFACSNEDDVTMSTGEEGVKSIVLKINGSGNSRALPGGQYDTNTELTSLDIYFTNSNSTIQQAYHLTPSTTDGDQADKNWDAITGTTGLRFVGLDNVSAVYVVANSPQAALEAGKKLDTDFIARLREQGPDLEQGKIIFAGNDIDINPVQADNNTDVPNYNGTEGKPADGDQVYTANVTIRPIISRMEWRNITIQGEGSAVRQQNGKYYLVEWSGWNPTLSGIYQSNVYLTDNVFEKQGSRAGNLFETPATSTGSIVNGAWVNPKDMGIGTDVWTSINSTIAYTGYNAEGNPLYNNVLPGEYDPTTQSVPFHFFVPFDPTQADAELDGNLAENPHWHFQLYYPEDAQDAYTVTVYNSNAEGENLGKADLEADDDALAVIGDFLFPVREDDLAYANIISLNGGSEGTPSTIKYRPGKIYHGDITIAPYNVTAGFRDVTDYNVIVKVSVVDFASVAVTPSFDKN